MLTPRLRLVLNNVRILGMRVVRKTGLPEQQSLRLFVITEIRIYREGLAGALMQVPSVASATSAPLRSSAS